MWLILKVIHIRQAGQMNDYTSERLTHVDATLRLEAINSMGKSVHCHCYDDGTERWTNEYPLFPYVLRSFSNKQRPILCAFYHTLVVYWTLKYCCVAGKVLYRVNRRKVFVLEVMVAPRYVQNPDTWTGLQFTISCFTSLPFINPLAPTTCTWDRFHTHSIRFYPRTRLLINS